MDSIKFDYSKICNFVTKEEMIALYPEARQALKAHAGDELYLFYNEDPPEDVPQVRPVTLEELEAIPADRGASPGTDWYVVDRNFTWTYVQTHEEDCGPYFCEAPKA